MKQCIALAAVVCVLGAGCAQSGFVRTMKNSLGDAGSGSQVATSRSAPRPEIIRTSCTTCGFDSCACGDEVDCGCDTGTCGCDGCSLGGRMDGCGGKCRGLLDGIAGGFCNGDGLCPHKHGYPEYPAFNPGPPVGTVAYPYYTIRGPRDFLLDKPPTIGPY